MLQELLSEDEACRLLKCGRTTLWELRRKGEIQYFRIGNRIKYKKEYLEKFLKSRESKITI